MLPKEGIYINTKGNRCEEGDDDVLYRFKYMQTDYDRFHTFPNKLIKNHVDVCVTWFECEIRFFYKSTDTLENVIIPLTVYQQDNKLETGTKHVINIKIPEVNRVSAEKLQAEWETYYSAYIDISNIDRYDTVDLANYVISCEKKKEQDNQIALDRQAMYGWNSEEIQKVLDVLESYEDLTTKNGGCCETCCKAENDCVDNAIAALSKLKTDVEEEEKDPTVDNTNKIANTEYVTPSFFDYMEGLRLSQLVSGNPRGSSQFVNIFDDISYYIPTIDSTGIDKAQTKVSVVLTIITNIGMVVTVLILAIIGIKYMLGSVEEKAEYKKDMIPYLIGAGLLFGISVIVKILAQIGDKINNI